ncbi:MAG: P-loop NTPase fold protein [Planctomycetota bacterium]|nr:P-loop NTPase fold protein [Planctomycetota bacterium]
MATRSTEDDAPGGNVALIGSYGSGKTSIYNLVRSEYEKLRRDHPKWPHFLFCRFEAWRHISAESALRGLVETVADRALKEADDRALWSLGEQYVLTVGPAHWGASRETGRRPLLDLLKLTRFQELVPELQPEVALPRVRRLRELANNDPTLFMPWAEVVGKTDPLEIPP